MIIDHKNRIPLPELYMALPPGILDTTLHLTRPVILIRDPPTFNKEWANMEASIHFLLCWRGISEDNSKDWLLNYLTSTRAYIEPGSDFDNLPSLSFCTPNLDKSSKVRSTYVFPPNF